MNVNNYSLINITQVVAYGESTAQLYFLFTSPKALWVLYISYSVVPLRCTMQRLIKKHDKTQ